MNILEQAVMVFIISITAGSVVTGAVALMARRRHL